MKKIIFFIIAIMTVLITTQVYALDYYTYEWENMYIEIEKGESIYKYIDLPKAKILKNGIELDEDVVYLKGDSFTSISTINTSQVGTYFLTYTAICIHIEEQATVTFQVVEIDREAPKIVQVADIIIGIGEKVNYNDYFIFVDNINKPSELEIKYQTTLEASKVGKYTLLVSCIDKSNNIATYTTTIVVIDKEPPKISLLKEIILEYGEEFDILKYITAIDNLDGNISSLIEYTNIDTKKLGFQNVDFRVVDSSGNETKFSTIVKVMDTVKPTVILSNNKISISIQDVLNSNYIFWIGYISSYYDNCDTLTIYDIVIDESLVFPIIGNYYVYYTISDKSGNTTKVGLYVNVYCDSSPSITVKSNISVNKGKSINYYRYISANDKYDGDITDNIEIDDSNVNINKKGIYVVTLKVKNSSNKYTYQTITIYVKESFFNENKYIFFLIIGVTFVGIYLYLQHKKEKIS